ncbi:Mg chelatase-related protein [Mycobacterium tuberculosis]|nr:Mg chelatase-related protein [Mycobacterium tuberculosis]
MNVTVPKVSSTELAGGQVNESSAQIRERVMAARQAQRERLEPYGLKTNAEMNGKILRGPLRLDAKLTGELNAAVDRGTLTARGYDRVLRIAWTLADLEGAAYPSREHLDVALFLRQQGQLT